MSRSVSLEAVLYLSLGLLAAWLRFAHLDQPPLNDLEAAAALTAADSPFASDPVTVPSPAYRSLTAAVFGLRGADEAAARWVPAAAGLLLVFTPLLLRRELGAGPTVAAVGLLAISPALWTASRSAGGSSLAALGVMAGSMLLVRAGSRPRPNLELAAAAGGLALVSGAPGFTGLLSVGAGWLVSRTVSRRRGNPHAETLPFPTDYGDASALRALLVAGAVVAVLGAGLGFLPDGLRGVFDGLGAWASGWVQRGGQPAGTVLLQLPAYEPLVLAFGGLAALRQLRAGRGWRLWMASWAAGGLAVLLAYPSREAPDILWVVVPLTLLAAPPLVRTVERVVNARPLWVLLGAGGGVLALLGFAYLQLRGYVSSLAAAQELLGVPALLGLAFMGGLLALTALALVAAGWSFDLAGRIAGGVSAVTLLALSLSAGAALNGPQPSPSELWRPQTGSPGLWVLRESLATLSEAETGRARALPIQLADAATPSLAWALRDHPRYDHLDPGQIPAVVLLREGGALPGEYLGQSLSIGERRVWVGAYPPQLLNWWLTRSGPTEQQRWVLLARQDVAGVERLEQLEQAEP